VDYEGVKDAGYPAKLVQRIGSLLDRRTSFEPSARNMALAREQFDYSVLSDCLIGVIERAITPPPGMDTKPTPRCSSS
jgi:hypothetical protein